MDDSISSVLFPELAEYIERLTADGNALSAGRRKILTGIRRAMDCRRAEAGRVDLVFICTHNSRRSQMAQIWAQTAAFCMSFSDARFFSGGTETTAFHPNAVDALRRAGFRIEKTTESENPVYIVRYGPETASIQAFSKRYADALNPMEPYGAVMTCSEAEKNCPFDPLAEFRIALPYEDPRYYDHTPKQNEAYDTRCRQIACEMLWMFGLSVP